MDSQFLKFWGNFLLQAAEGRQQVENLSRWMTAGFAGERDLTELFKKAYGLSAESGKDPFGAEAWSNAAAQFQKSFSEYVESFNVVPRSRYEILGKEKEALEKRVKEQEETIRQLRLKLSESRMEGGEIVSGFQQLMEVQNEQFRQVSEALNRFFTPSPKKEGPKS